MTAWGTLYFDEGKTNPAARQGELAEGTLGDPSPCHGMTWIPIPTQQSLGSPHLRKHQRCCAERSWDVVVTEPEQPDK